MSSMTNNAILLLVCLASTCYARQVADAQFMDAESQPASLAAVLSALQLAYQPAQRSMLHSAGNPSLAGAASVASKRSAVEMAERRFAAPQKLKLGAKKYAGITTAKTRDVNINFDVRQLGGFTEPTVNPKTGREAKGDMNWLKSVDPYGLGYFDPWGFTIDASAGKIRAYREAELKHGRIAMLAALGFVVQEKFHPLFDGSIDGASVYALQKSFEYEASVWLAPLLLVLFCEAVSGFSIFLPKPGQVTGDALYPLGLTFDPLGLSPKDPEAFKEMRTKELNNGRLAMIGIAGLFTQEAITGQPIFS